MIEKNRVQFGKKFVGNLKDSCLIKCIALEFIRHSNKDAIRLFVIMSIQRKVIDIMKNKRFSMNDI